MKVLFYDKVYDTEKDTIDTIKDDLSKRLEKRVTYSLSISPLMQKPGQRSFIL